MRIKKVIMDLLSHKFIIIGSDHSNTLGQIRCLGEKGIRPIVVITEQEPFIITKSRYLGELHQVSSIAEAPRYVAEHWGNEPVKPFLYTDRDDFMCAIDDSYDLLVGKFFFWNAGEKGRIRRMINKEEQMALAAECGLNVIPTEHVKRGELPQSLQYPIFTKATNSLNPYWKANCFVCHNNQELMDAYAHMGIDEVLLQRYIKKKDEAPVQGMSIDGGRLVKLFARKTSERFASNNFGVYSRIEQFSDTEIEQKIALFMRKVGYSGIFEVEFIQDERDIQYFLEVNFRCTMSIHAYAEFGVNIPYLFAKSTINGEIPFDEIQYSQKKDYRMMIELEDLKESVIHGNTSLWQWLSDFCNTDSYLYIDKRDMGPFWSLLQRKAGNVVRSLLGLKKR